MVNDYIKFIINSSNEHGVHSPFVYKLVTECFYKKSPSTIQAKIRSYKEKLKANKNFINVTDLGSGSRVFKSNRRKISAIAKNASISTKHALLLNRIVAYLKCEEILELGTSLGTGTFSLVINNPKAKITSIEGCPETLKIAQNALKEYQSQLNLIQGDFKKVLPDVLKTKYDLIYFDGNHQKEATLTYFKKCLQAKHNDTVFIFDDIYWSQGMKEAWQEIKEHPEVKVTVDIFQWGLVFFRREQVKEHFKIRY
ncbi:O-methyltransferase [Wenyingzhuangia aestuarii]|uniref:O-methyltransferase n=1 Tax=Wenyingzhuangia aestuarii TaxID=1647582 RepID=UPI00143958AF|nr:class I SAM-dependent methyltransferase [Wenyingzhuangia aestuarii]NJB83330.1 putative O-methyltransferase YrrM [Wenyingzhuangia aestuarii]